MAAPADAHVLAELCEAHAAYERLTYDPQGHVIRLAQALQHTHLHAWLALLEGLPVGYATATLDFSTLSAQPYLHLDCLFLDEPARGQGLGHALMQAVQMFGRTQGCSHLQWQTPTWNHAAIRFYDRTGAVRLEKQRYALQL